VVAGDEANAEEDGKVFAEAHEESRRGSARPADGIEQEEEADKAEGEALHHA